MKTIKGLDSSQIKLLQTAGITSREDIIQQAEKFFHVASKHPGIFKVKEHLPEQIFLHVTGIEELSPQEAYNSLIRFPTKLWCSINSVFSIGSLSARIAIHSYGVNPLHMEEAQGALLLGHIFRMHHLDRQPKDKLKRILGPYLKYH